MNGQRPVFESALPLFTCSMCPHTHTHTRQSLSLKIDPLPFEFLLLHTHTQTESLSQDRSSSIDRPPSVLASVPQIHPSPTKHSPASKHTSQSSQPPLFLLKDGHCQQVPRSFSHRSQQWDLR